MIPDFAQSLYECFEREGIPLLLAVAGRFAIMGIHDTRAISIGSALARMKNAHGM
jgi:hypothetical protein